jgi:DNA-binding ferritin-like protein
MTAEETQGDERNLNNIAADIIASAEARIGVVREIVEDTHQMMSDFKERRETMSKELRETLAKCESLRKKDFDRMMSEIVARQNKREEEVRRMLEDFRKEEEMVTEQLRNLLQKGEEVRIRDFKKMMQGIRRKQENNVKETNVSIADELQSMQREVHIMLENFKQERQSVATAWYEMLGLFQKEKTKDGIGAQAAQKT